MLSLPAHAELSAGAATSNITPKMGVPLDGTIMQVGPATDVHDELHARCLVLGDGRTKLAFVVVDNTMVSRKVFDRAKAEIEQQTGIPPSHVCLSATHSHSTPRAVVDLVDDDLHREYLDFLASRIADGVRRAINRMRPATIGWGSFEEPRFVHNRRWVLAENFRALNVNPFGEKGEIVKMNPGRDGLEKPSGPVDPEVFVVGLRDAETGEPLAILSAYGLHYIGGVPRGVVSADYYGVYADSLTRELGVDRHNPPFVAMMANGTSGDVNAIDPTQPRQKREPYTWMTEVGESLAGQVAEVFRSMKPIGEPVTLAAAAEDLELGVRKPDEKRIAWAEKTKAGIEPGKRLTQAQIYARETWFLKAYPDTVSIPIQVFRIGGMAVVQIPCEVFAETGLQIKQESPFPGSTFTIELANGFFGYLPTARQFDWGGYETWPARSSLLEVGAEAKIRETVGILLARLKAEAG
ncbi:MAG: neutral/alkaline non-lysosomal ceramidase N-terminal domain-containing protein [Verrucomicrobiae bacterium]|nr:neutral/alkaline non-lysosomal ceramidase N-terminal domain-containing protein [Verrucomicrobiae bacterium]